MIKIFIFALSLILCLNDVQSTSVSYLPTVIWHGMGKSVVMVGFTYLNFEIIFFR